MAGKSVVTKSPLRTRRRGLSLPEVMISALLVGIVLVASMKTVGAVFRTRLVNARLADGPSLARQLMTETAQAPYEDPEEPDGPIGLETGETNTSRTDFDDVDDFHGWNKSPPQAKDGTPLDGCDGWQRQVSVEWVQPDSLTASGTETGLKRITVTVTDPQGNVTQLGSLRCEFGAVEQDPAVNMTVVTWLGGELQLGAGSAKVLSATNLVNHARDQ